MQRKTLCSLQTVKLRKIKDLFKSSLKDLYDAEELVAISRMVFTEVLNLSPSELLLNQDENIKEETQKELIIILERLKQAEPVQYVLRAAWFCDLKFKVNKHVLIPRPETEELVRWILEENKFLTPSILDVGTGSGCIAIALAKQIKKASVSAMEISTEALKVANHNALSHAVEIRFLKDTILQPMDSSMRYDIIVSNPPYVMQSEKESINKHVLDFEPHLALFVDDNDALIFYKAIIEFADSHLHVGGKLYFEINEAKSQAVVSLFNKRKFKNVTIKKDMQGKERMVMSVKA